MTTLDLQVVADADDTSHTSAGAWSGTSNFLVIGRTGGSGRDSSLRFTAATIPQGATIDVAYMIFVAAANASGTDALTDIRTHDHDASPQITSLAEWDATVAVLTSSIIVWDNIPSWSTGEEIQTPSLVSIVQDVVDRAGFNEVLHFFVLDDGSTESAIRQIRSHDLSTIDAAKLHIEYTEPAAGSDITPGGSSQGYMVY